MSEARRGDTESMALTTTSTSVDELASLVLQIKSIPTTSSETNDILKKLQTLHKKIAAEIVSQKKVNEEELSILKKKEAEQQLHVYQLTTASRSKHDGTLRAHDAAQIELRRGEKILEKCQENIKLTQIQAESLMQTVVVVILLVLTAEVYFVLFTETHTFCL